MASDKKRPPSSGGGGARDSCGAAAAGVEGATAECRRLSCREVYASVRANAPTASAHTSSRLATNTSDENVASLADNHDNLMSELFDKIPDVRDGLSREERVVLYVLHETQRERGDRNVPTAMLWGQVCEHFYISPEELSLMLARLGARK